MGRFGKFIGGALGWAVGGPIGALVGFSLGYLFDNTKIETKFDGYPGKAQRHQTNSGDFGISLIVLSAVVMKADGKVMKSELDYVKRFFEQQFGKAKAAEMVKALGDVLKQDISVREVTEQIRYYMQHAMRLQMLHYLFGIANADGHVSAEEVATIKKIATYLGISTPDFESIKAMFVKDTESAYTILELNRSATDAELKRAYRKMAVKYHPDKVSHLGDEFQKAAKEKFQKVQEAYDNIKKERRVA